MQCQLNAMGTTNVNYFCPTRRRPQAYTWKDGTPSGNFGPGGTLPASRAHAAIDYAGSCFNTNGGLAPDGNWPNGDQWSNVSSVEGDGAIRRNKSVRIVDITDGTSNTLLAGEKQLNIADLELSNPPGDDDYGYYTFDNDSMRCADPNHPPMPDTNDPSNTGGTPDGLRFGSSHPGGFNALLADGSVRFIPYTINATTFWYLGNRSDGQVIGSGLP
jgi:prepilin-type processing-associated H-X9-DG protein